MTKKNHIIVDGIKYQLVKQTINDGVCEGCSFNIEGYSCLNVKNIKCEYNTIYKKLSDIRKSKIKKNIK
jgi:hypothetical protein